MLEHQYKILLSNGRCIIVKITVITPDTGICGIPLGHPGRRYHYRPIGMIVQISLNGFRIAAAAGTDKGADSRFRTVGFLKHVGLILMDMRCWRCCRRGRRCRSRCSGRLRASSCRTGRSCRSLRGGSGLSAGRRISRRAGYQLIDWPRIQQHSADHAGSLLRSHLGCSSLRRHIPIRSHMAWSRNHFRIKISAATGIFPKPRQNTAWFSLCFCRVLMDVGKLLL